MANKMAWPLLAMDTMTVVGSARSVARRWLVSVAERMAGLQNRLIDLLSGGEAWTIHDVGTTDQRAQRC